jgi:carbon monoxide dehydrogenase subunit G
MIKYESHVVVNRPVDEVSAYIVDPDTHQEWMTDVQSVEHLTDGPASAGSRFRYGIRKGSMSMNLTFRVVRLDQSAIEYETEPGGPLNWRARLGFESAGNGSTRVTSAGQISLGGVRRLLEPLMAGEVRSGEAGELEALKRVLESRAAPVAAVSAGGVSDPEAALA